MRIHKILVVVLGVLIIGEGVYLGFLSKKLSSIQQEDAPDIKIEQKIPTKAQPKAETPELYTKPDENQQKEEKKLNSPPETGVREEIKKRLAQWHKEPVEQVIERCKKKLEKNPEDVEAHLQLAEIFVYFPEKQEEALDHFEIILGIQPEHPKRAYMEFWTNLLQQENLPPANENMPPDTVRINTGQATLLEPEMSIQELLEQDVENTGSIIESIE